MQSVRTLGLGTFWHFDRVINQFIQEMVRLVLTAWVIDWVHSWFQCAYASLRLGVYVWEIYASSVPSLDFSLAGNIGGHMKFHAIYVHHYFIH